MPVLLPGSAGALVTVADLHYDGDPGTADRALVRAWNAVVAECGWDPLRQQRTWTRPIGRFGQTTAHHLPGLNIDPATVTGVETGAAITYTYVAGYDDPASLSVLRDVVVDEATRYLDNPRGIRSWSVGNESETYMGNPGQSALSTDSRLDRFRLPSVA